MNGIIFVYNADSGLFNTLTDIAHKVFSPETYSCNLCAITYGNFGMRQEWKEFLETLEIPMQFLHRDEFHERYGMQGLALPAVLLQEGEQLRLLVSADEIGRCADMADLKGLLQEKLK
ncbi:hypothetical protein Geob_2748 [Geotalea daltonii FRC-32]|uniref:GTPase n=1 Tax=Geotalea daltonii (strain DSM 22248 / JCM 15807 / FRC-32) TaxID=316067 RepID=B9M1L5_GEODF|nr:hypothetical protein [Geotalea daltonii]ACM21097.1 hypothetical protein Geob_2748 [Geotalea daltonii FRC-32]